MPDLKPCPFCGRKPSKVRQHQLAGLATIYYTVDCKAPVSRCPCRPKTTFFKSEEAVIEAWNRRAREEKQIGVVFCRECKLQGNCFAEDHFNFAGIKDPFCCVGKRKEGAENEH